MGFLLKLATSFPGGAVYEFRQILQNLKALMDENGLTSDPVDATIFTTAFDRFPEINTVWDEFFATGATLPARSAVGVSQLPIGAQVEAEFLFYDDGYGRRG